MLTHSPRRLAPAGYVLGTAGLRQACIAGAVLATWAALLAAVAPRADALLAARVAYGFAFSLFTMGIQAYTRLVPTNPHPPYAPTCPPRVLPSWLLALTTPAR
eukprot:1195303-Prorocentrum_minimum.AAC.4